MDKLTRRDFVSATLPAAALAGVGFAAATASAQQRKEDERDRRDVRDVRDGRDGRDGRDQEFEERRRGPGGIVRRMMAEAYVDDEYRVPPLPYPYDALEPHIDALTMQLHHERHHRSYVDGLNRALGQLQTLGQRGYSDPLRLAALEKEISFNGGGHMLHTLFWATMSPRERGEPEGELAEAIGHDFGSLDRFRNHFTRVASGVKGSGWGILAYEPMSDGLVVLAAQQHDTHLTPGAQALLAVDVWEHAYYLKYQNARGEYLKAWWDVVNWRAVGQWYEYIRGRHLEEPRRPVKRRIRLFEFDGD